MVDIGFEISCLLKTSVDKKLSNYTNIIATKSNLSSLLGDICRQTQMGRMKGF